MDIILVGDSLGIVALGLDDTGEVTMEDMVLHCRSVSRAAKSSFIVSHMILFLAIMTDDNLSGGGYAYGLL
jgi:3-methyl-2-oxobutanoate hydroxymethyltransferase